MKYVDLIKNNLIKVGQRVFYNRIGKLTVYSIADNPVCPIICKDTYGNQYAFTSKGFSSTWDASPSLFPREGVAHWNDEKPIIKDGDWVIGWDDTITNLYDFGRYMKDSREIRSLRYPRGCTWNNIKPFDITTLPKELQDRLKAIKED